MAAPRGPRKDPAAVSLGRRGGKAAGRSMTPEQRSTRARNAALARISKLGQIPRKTAPAPAKIVVE